mgnify:CR=1 FL=1
MPWSFYQALRREIALSYLLKLENVSKSYHLGGNQILALQHIHFHVSRGEMTAIIGASGSGKTTLMNIMGLLDRCTSGAYYFADREVSSLSEEESAFIRNKRIGFVFQSFFLLPRLNALQNVVLPLFYRGVSRNEAKELAHA